MRFPQQHILSCPGVSATSRRGGGLVHPYVNSGYPGGHPFVWYGAQPYAALSGRQAVLPRLKPIVPMAETFTSEPKKDEEPVETLSWWRQVEKDLGMIGDPDSRPLYQYVTPSQALTLFLGGVATSVALRWMIQGAKLPRLSESLGKWRTQGKTPIEDLAKRAIPQEGQPAIRHDVGTFFVDEGPLTAFQFAMTNPEVRGRILGYLGSSVLGYMLGSFVGGIQEIWVRREEMQIRSELLQRLTRTFRKSIQSKSQMDIDLQADTRSRIVRLLREFHVPDPESIVKNRLPESVMPDKHNTGRFPYEPIHFSNPMAYAGTPGATRFGFSEPSDPLPSLQAPPFSPAMMGMKSLLFGLGLTMGVLGQMALVLLRPGGRNLPPLRQVSQVFNVKGVEALFVTGKALEIWSFVGLTATAKVGKMLLDGYRDIMVFRKHADTELNYQKGNWLHLDTQFHGIAQQEAVAHQLIQLKAALPFIAHNRPTLTHRVQAILTDVAEGRYAAPRYWLMTPPVNLTAARS